MSLTHKKSFDVKERFVRMLDFERCLTGLEVFLSIKQKTLRENMPLGGF
jgi:hypothetical protein